MYYQDIGIYLRGKRSGRGGGYRTRKIQQAAMAVKDPLTINSGWPLFINGQYTVNTDEMTG